MRQFSVDVAPQLLSLATSSLCREKERERETDIKSGLRESSGQRGNPVRLWRRNCFCSVQARNPLAAGALKQLPTRSSSSVGLALLHLLFLLLQPLGADEQLQDVLRFLGSPLHSFIHSQPLKLSLAYNHQSVCFAR